MHMTPDFYGVVPCCEIEQFKRHKVVGLIVNTDPHNKAGKHWIGLYKEGQMLNFFDSFGREIKEEREWKRQGSNVCTLHRRQWTSKEDEGSREPARSHNRLQNQDCGEVRPEVGGHSTQSRPLARTRLWQRQVSPLPYQAKNRKADDTRLLKKKPSLWKLVHDLSWEWSERSWREGRWWQGEAERIRSKDQDT